MDRDLILHGPAPHDPVTDARALIQSRFPQAIWALLTGSVITPDRTPGSDLDIVILLPATHLTGDRVPVPDPDAVPAPDPDAVPVPDPDADRGADPRLPHRTSLHFRDWPVELFVHDEQSLAHYRAIELAQRKPHLHRMIARGIALVGEPALLQEQCAAVLAAGPTPLTAAERDLARYGLTDLIDDLAHAADPGERAVITQALWTATAQGALALADHWVGRGKWLLRELRAMDDTFAERWLAAHGDPAAVTAVARDVLDRAGGPLFDGFHALGERP